MKLSQYLLVPVACAVLAGCGESEAQKEARIRANIQVMSESAVRAKLKDPGSAQFKNQRVSAKGAACGEVNSKNSFGGYTGYTRYIFAGKDLTIFESDMAPGEFDTSWRQVCS